MDNSRKSPLWGSPETGLDNASYRANSNKVESKINRLLSAFAKGMSLNRFEAELEAGVQDHVLPSTVSDIQRRFGLIVSRTLEPVSGYNGKPIYVCRYWLSREERERARQLLDKSFSEVAA